MFRPHLASPDTVCGPGPRTAPFAACGGPNDVWCIDLKGWFHCGDGKRCDPLTLSDAYSRYLLRCQGLKQTDVAHAWPVLDLGRRVTKESNALDWRPFVTDTWQVTSARRGVTAVACGSRSMLRCAECITTVPSVGGACAWRVAVQRDGEAGFQIAAGASRSECTP